ncbi:cation efflux protein [Wallemia mellicola]|nr:cation efflux protein [Wallemia mellicola]
MLIPWRAAVDISRRANLFPYDKDVDQPSTNKDDVRNWLEAFSKHDWRRLPDHEGIDYLPQQPPIKLSAGTLHSQKDYTFDRFTHVSLEEISSSPGCIFNAGGPVIALDWCKTRRLSHPLKKSYVAISTSSSNQSVNGIGAQDLKSYKSSIQIWGHLPTHIPDPAQPQNIVSAKAQLLAVLCTNKGLPIDLKFAPTDAPDMEYDDPSHCTAGALAVTFNNGEVDVAVLPDFDLLRSFYGASDDEVLYLDFIPTLSIEKPKTKGLSLEWASSNRLAVGFSNGIQFDKDNRLFAHSPTFQYTKLVVDKDLTQLVTSGYDGSIFISDLRIAGSGNNGGTSMFDHSRSLVYSISYHIFASSIVTTNFDDNIQLIGLLGTDYKRASNFAEFRSPVWNIATSTCHPFVAICGANGHVEINNPVAVMESRYKRKNINFSTDVYGIEYGRSEDKYRMIDNLSPADNKLGATKEKAKPTKKEIEREELGKYASAFPTESGVKCLAWNPDVNRSAVLASGMLSGLKLSLSVARPSSIVMKKFGIVLAISCVFFVSELVVGLKTRSLALIADSFHYLSDLVAYIIAFTAAYLREHGKRLPGWTYGWHRAELVGAFFNGVFLLGLALSIFLQSIERFFNPETVDQPLAVIVLGAVGLALNIVSAAFVHDHHGHSHGHSHSKGHDHKHGDEEGDDEENAGLLSRHSHDGHNHDDEHNEVHPDSESENLHQMHNHVRLPPPIDPHGDLDDYSREEDSATYRASIAAIPQARTLSQHKIVDSNSCQDPYSKFGRLQVDLQTKQENVWIPYDKDCQPPRLMASLLNNLDLDNHWSPASSPSTHSQDFENISFVKNKTVLVVGDSIARETVRYFCELLGEDVVNLNDDHPWSPFREYTSGERTRRRAPRESSLPNVCYIPSIDFMIIQMFHFGLDQEEFFKDKEQYNPPNNFEDRLKVHGRDVFDYIHNDKNPPEMFEGAVPRKTPKPDLVEVSSTLWDLARFAKIDINKNTSTLTDLEEDRLDFYMNRMSDVLDTTLEEFPDSQLVWRTSHYPSDCNNNKLDWIGRDLARLEQEREHQNKPYFHSNRLFQLEQATRHVLSQPDYQDQVRINEWGHLMFGQHAHQIDQLHPSMLPGGWLWGDTMLYELRRAVE